MAEKMNKVDVIIAGGGPAGMSALLWCADLGLNAVLLEKEIELGGQLLYTYNAIKNYLGIEAATGRELRDIFLRQIANAKIERRCGAEIVGADLAGTSMTLADGTMYSGRAIIIATGVRRRKLKVPGEEEFRGRGILESGAKAVDEVSGKTVVIVGGGDAALENALILSENARKIFVVHRRKEFTARRDFTDQAKALGKIEFLPDNKLTTIVGKGTVKSVELEHLISGKSSQIETDAVLIRIGVEPNTELFRGQIELDEKGYVIIDSYCAANLSNVFACGDVANPSSPTIATAVGHGATAVKALFRELSSR